MDKDPLSIYRMERGFDYFEGALYLQIHILICKIVIK